MSIQYGQRLAPFNIIRHLILYNIKVFHNGHYTHEKMCLRTHKKDISKKFVTHFWTSKPTYDQLAPPTLTTFPSHLNPNFMIIQSLATIFHCDC